MVLSGKLEGGVGDFFERFFGPTAMRPIAFNPGMFQLVRKAFDNYDAGRNRPAGLTFGHCISCAVAKLHNLPLLFKGRGFARTDIRPALTP